MIEHLNSLVYYIREKDTFFYLYELYLCHRFLSNKEGDDKNEEKFIEIFAKNHGI